MAYPLSSSPYQRVPSTPQVTRSNQFSSPAFLVPQQNLYSSPVPDNAASDSSQASTPFHSRYQDNASLISEGASYGGGVEQVVPATPIASASIHAFHPVGTNNHIQLPFTIDAWTTETPAMRQPMYQNEIYTQSSSSSQDEIPIPLAESQVTPEQPINNRLDLTPVINNYTAALISTPIRSTASASRTNIRQTPRRTIENSVLRRHDFLVGQTEFFDGLTSQTPRRLNVLLRRHTTPSINRRALRSHVSNELDLFYRENIFD